MKAITKKQIAVLAAPEHKGGYRKSPLLEELAKLRLGSSMLVSKDEYTNKWGYKSDIHNYIGSMTSQSRKAHRSRITGMRFEVTTYEIGWVITKTKVESIK